MRLLEFTGPSRPDCDAAWIGERRQVEMNPTMILCGLVFGRWCRVTLMAAALGWPLLLVVTDVAGIDSTLIGAAALADVNAGVEVLGHRGAYLAYRRFRRPVGCISDPSPASGSAAPRGSQPVSHRR
jgi:hypothetical protein